MTATSIQLTLMNSTTNFDLSVELILRKLDQILKTLIQYLKKLQF